MCTYATQVWHGCGMHFACVQHACLMLAGIVFCLAIVLRETNFTFAATVLHASIVCVVCVLDVCSRVACMQHACMQEFCRGEKSVKWLTKTHPKQIY